MSLAKCIEPRLVWGRGSVQKLRRLLPTFGELEGKQNRNLYTRTHRPTATKFDPPTHHHVNFEIGKANSLSPPSTRPRLQSGGHIKVAKTKIQDKSPQALSPVDEETLNRRLSEIWWGTMALKPIPEWECIISRRSTEDWLSQIAEHIPADVKSMLVSDHPPTPDRLMALPWSITADGGVFAFLTKPHGNQDSSGKMLYIYIGSASKYYGGLNIRKTHFLSRVKISHDEPLKRRIKKLRLNTEGEFKTLFIVPFKSGSDEDVMEVRKLVILARLVLMIWLGAVDGALKTTQHLSPWRLEKIEYVGLAQDNPLRRSFNRSSKTKKENAKGQRKQRPVVLKGKAPIV